MCGCFLYSTILCSLSIPNYQIFSKQRMLNHKK
nr:MAG TPA: hypothetical protein [Caudoviricetes sp.]